MLTLTFFHGKKIRYVIMCEASGDVWIGAEEGGGCFLHGGARMRVEMPQEVVKACCWEIDDHPVPFIEDWEIFRFNAPVAAVLYTIMSRVTATIIPMEYLTQDLLFVLKEASGFVLEVERDKAVVGHASALPVIANLIEPGSAKEEV